MAPFLSDAACYSLQVGFVFALGSLLIADFETFVRHLIFSTSAPLFRSETEDEGDQRPKTLPSLPMKACLIFVWMPFFLHRLAIQSAGHEDAAVEDQDGKGARVNTMSQPILNSHDPTVMTKGMRNDQRIQ